MNERALIDVIIPTVAGREDSLERLLTSLRRCTPQDIPLKEIVVEDSETCGWGWHRGLRASLAPYVLLACDDQEIVSPRWAEVCIETAAAGKLPCPRVYFPDGRVESQGGDMNAYRHVNARPQRDRTAVDYTTIPFLSRAQVEAIGMLPDLHYCSDVWVSYRGRQLGYDTELRHGFDVVHHRELIARGAGYGEAERDGLDEKRMRKELELCESSSLVG